MNYCGGKGTCEDTIGHYLCQCEDGYWFNTITCTGEWEVLSTLLWSKSSPINGGCLAWFTLFSFEISFN